MNDINTGRLGLDAGARALVQTLTLDGYLDGNQVRRVYGGDCEAVLLVVPRGQASIVEHALSRVLFSEETA
jgi:hypothetical protein